MDILKEGDAKSKIVSIICIVDLIQPAIIILIRAWSIIFRSAVSDTEFIISEHNSSIVVLLFAVVICFYVIHLTIGLKLFSALEQMECDALLAARNAKVWQSWSIIFLFFLIGNLFANILSSTAKIAIAYATITGVCEIGWRLFGIYYVGLFIDELVERIPGNINLVPTIKFFGVRFPLASESSRDELE